MHFGCSMKPMAEIIQVRNVPEEIHAELVRQAARAGLSLNRYLLAEFGRIARRGRNAEIFKRAAKESGKRPSAQEIVRIIREDRERGH